MTISNTSRTAGPFVGNGITKDFPFSFKVFNRYEVLVAVTDSMGNETLLVLDSDFTITLNPDQNGASGGLISLAAPLANGATMAATSDVPIVQTVDLTNGGGFYPAVINTALDRIVINIQQLAARVGAGALNVGSAALIASILTFKDSLSTSSGSSLVGFIQSGVGTVKRTLQEKLRATVDVEDWGAVGNGIADDWAAITACLNAMEARGRNVTVNMTKRYRTTKTITIPSFVRIKGPTPSRYPFNNGNPAPAVVADFTNPNQWVFEPRTKSGGAAVPYNALLTSLPDGAAFNVGIEDLLITSTGVTPFGGVRIHGCPGAVVKNVSILNTGIGLFINESFGCDFQVHTQTLYYGVIGWGEVNACTIDAYCTQADPKPKTVPASYVFPGINSLNGSMIGIGLATEDHYKRPFGMVFGAPFNQTSSNNEIGFTSEYFNGGVFICNARSVNFSRLYVEGSANEVAYGIVSTYSSFLSAATHAYFSGTGTLLDFGFQNTADINLNGVISYANFKPPGTVANNSHLTVRGAQFTGSGLTKPEINVVFPDDSGSWMEPSLLNNWTNSGGANSNVAYRLNPYSKEVEMKGVPIGGIENQPIFTLPAGYRPLARGSYPVVVTSATSPIGAVVILATGEVIPITAGMSSSGLDLMPVRFRAEQ